VRTRTAASADVVGAVLLGLVGLGEVVSGVRLGGIGTATPPRAVAVVAVLAGTLPLAVRRGRPALAALVVAGAVAAQAVLLHRVSLVAGLLPLLVVVYSSVVHGTRLRTVGPLLGLAVVVTLAVGIPEERDVGEQLFGAFAVLCAAGTGVVVGRRQRSVDRAAEALQRVESAAEASTARALADERAAIARELHDVIAHGVSVMGVLAGGARVLVDRDPAAAKDALRTIEAQARESVEELQRLLGMLRAASDGGADRAPQPGLLQVETLVEQLRGAGLPVELTVQGERRPLPAGVDLAAFRVVQEALTNVLKHAGQVPADVRLRYERDAVCVQVTNSGAAAPVPKAGHGLLGMRERVGLYGGHLRVGPGPAGFTVDARIPVQEHQ
jgi:signal transduction histidine kinase